MKGTLDHISGQYDSLDICLMECLSCWLKQVDKVNDKGGPTWIALTSSLRDIDEGVVANSIDEESKSFKKSYNFTYLQKNQLIIYCRSISPDFRALLILLMLLGYCVKRKCCLRKFSKVLKQYGHFQRE